MTLPDIVNGCFELSGGYFVGMSIFKLHREKIVRGVAWQGVAFFSTWGLWNLYFYPSLGQWASFIGGVSIAAANAVWLGQIVYYSWTEGQR
jgi:hypothetical protein